MARQMLMSLHKCWLRRTEKWPFWRWIYSQPWTPMSFSPRSRPADLRQLKLTLHSVCFSVCFERGEDVDGTHAEGIAQLCWVDCNSVCAATPQILRCVWLVYTSVDAATCVLKCNYTSLYSQSQGNCLMHESFEAVCAQDFELTFAPFSLSDHDDAKMSKWKYSYTYMLLWLSWLSLYCCCSLLAKFNTL